MQKKMKKQNQTEKKKKRITKTETINTTNNQ